MSAVATGQFVTPPNGLERLYSRYRPYVFRMASRCLRSQADAEDITQEVFIEFWRNPPEAQEGTASLLAWLAATTKTRCWMKLRRDRSRPQSAPLEDQFTYCDSAFDHIFQARQVAVALSTVPPDCRPLLSLMYRHDLAPAEIARHLDLPLITVRRRLRMTVGKLQRAMISDRCGFSLGPERRVLETSKIIPFVTKF